LVLAVWMEALPFDITRNPARRVESFADEPRMIHFYDQRQVVGKALAETIDWQDESLPWDIFLVYPAGVIWQAELPEPDTWFHQREEANRDRFRTGQALGEALLGSLGDL
jgi:hypothetical protein